MTVHKMVLGDFTERLTDGAFGGVGLEPSLVKVVVDHLSGFGPTGGGTDFGNVQLKLHLPECIIVTHINGVYYVDVFPNESRARKAYEEMCDNLARPVHRVTLDILPGDPDDMKKVEPPGVWDWSALIEEAQVAVVKVENAPIE